MSRCPERPEDRLGQPIGQYHCPTCGCMCVAGVPHEVTGHEPDCPYAEPDPSTEEES